MAAIGILAHQGGWDELLLVGGPIVVFGALLAVARRRALALAAERGNPVSTDEATTDDNTV